MGHTRCEDDGTRGKTNLMEWMGLKDRFQLNIMREKRKKERKHPLLPKYSCLKGNETFCDPQNASRLK